MELPIQISFHNTPPSDSAETAIRERVAQLESLYDRIQSCRVVVDVPHRHHKEGNLFQVRIDLRLPNGEIVVKRDPSEHREYRDLDTIIHDAFDDARRQLEDHVRRIRGHVKTHEELPHGKVARVFRDQGYGFLETPLGREVYFHRNSVLNGGFDHLDVGTEVVFAEEDGEKGPQASTVRLLSRNHRH